MVDHKCEKDTDIELLKHTNKHITKKIDDIHKALMGNGKPGLITDVNELKIIQRTHDDVIKMHSKVLDKLNVKLATYGGAIATIVTIITYIL